MTLKQLWCGLTPGHDYYESGITRDIITLDCRDCEHRIYGVLRDETTRLMHSQVKDLDKKITDIAMGDAAPLRFPLHGGETLSHFEVPKTERADDVPNGPAGSVGVCHPNKTDASKRKRGPNGRFLPIKSNAERIMDALHHGDRKRSARNRREIAELIGKKPPYTPMQLRNHRRRNKRGQFVKKK